MLLALNARAPIPISPCHPTPGQSRKPAGWIDPRQHGLLPSVKIQRGVSFGCSGISGPADDMATPQQPSHQHQPQPARRMKRVFLFNGWLRTHTYPRLWMKPLSEYLRATAYEGTEVIVVGNTMPAQTNDVEKYVRHLASLVQTPTEDDFFIGQSVGCQVILRYLAQLPAGAKVGGFLAVGCWMYLDHTTRRRRSSAIDSLIQDAWEGFQRWMEYGDVDFENLRRVCGGNLVALMSNDDPYRGLDDDGLSNKRDWEEMVGARVVMRRGKGHFNCLRLDAEDLDFVEREFLGLRRRSKGALLRDDEGKEGPGKKPLKRGQFRSRL